MKLAKRLVKGARITAPVVALATAGSDGPPTHGDLAVIDGASDRTRELRDLLGSPTGTPTGARLAVAAPGGDVDEVGAMLARRRAAGDAGLAVLVGGPAERRRMEADLRAGHGIEPADLVHVASLEGPGGRTVLDAVARGFGADAPAAARHLPALRPGVGRRIVRDSALRAAVVGALPVPGAHLPALAVLQIRMVASLSAAHDRPLGPERVLEALAIIGAGFGWRAVGRSSVRFVPGVGWAASGAVAYLGTRAIGEAALARLSAGHDLIDAGPLAAARPKFDRLLGRLQRG